MFIAIHAHSKWQNMNTAFTYHEVMLRLCRLSYSVYRVAQKTGTLCFVRLNFVKYWPIFKLISLPESGNHM